jgi:hypothetical protein
MSGKMLQNMILLRHISEKALSHEIMRRSKLQICIISSQYRFVPKFMPYAMFLRIVLQNFLIIISA